MRDLYGDITVCDHIVPLGADGADTDGNCQGHVRHAAGGKRGWIISDSDAVVIS
jgi:hypothetical protein